MMSYTMNLEDVPKQASCSNFPLFDKNTEETEEVIAKRSEWVSNYDAEKKKIAKVVAQFWGADAPYYGDLVDKILNDENFVPSEKQFKKFIGTKNAAKVITASFAPAKYPVNTLVEARALSWNTEAMQGKKAFVLKVDAAPVECAHKGAKRYLVLPIGAAAPLLVEEREIRAVKKIKKKVKK